MRRTRFPDFICIGAQKAGTTWLQKALSGHPQIWLPPLKEIHYFDRLQARKVRPPSASLRLDQQRARRIDDAITRLGNSSRPVEERERRHSSLEHIRSAQLTDEWYGSIFMAAPPTSKCGEITPEYALLPEEGFHHISALNVGVRLIFIMRDPIDRSWSALRMAEKRDPSGRVDHITRGRRPEFLAYSDYTRTIDRIQKHFSPENILLLFFDDLADEPEKFMHRVMKFVGVEQTTRGCTSLSRPVHAGSKKEMPPELYRELRSLLAPVYESLLNLDSPTVEKWYRLHYAQGAQR